MTDYQPEQLPVEFWQQPLTARMLDDFAVCPRKFLLSFFTTREDERRFRGGSAALHEAVRTAIVGFHKLGAPAQAPLQALLEAFESAWDGSLCADGLEEKQYHAQGQRMLRDYCDDLVANPVRLLGTDVRLEGQLSEQVFVAVADLLLSPAPGQITCQRLVTSRSPLGTVQLAQDLSAQLLWLLAHGHPFGEPAAVTVSYYALRKRKAHAVVLTPEAAEQARHEIVSRVARLHRETDFAPHKGKPCRWCRSRARCPAWP